VVFSAAGSFADAPGYFELIPIAWAAALLACLRGPAFLALYEERQAGVEWRSRGMRALWWAIVLNGATLVNVSTLLIDAWWEPMGCFGPIPSINHYAPTYWPSVALAGLLLVGLGLLARQRTAGLLLTGIVSVVFPVVLMTYLRSFSAAKPAQELLPAVPGLLAAWLAVGFWAKPMFRLLRS
jgi:hypothetical protein